MRGITGKVTSDDFIQNHNKCIVHFLDIRNTTTIKEYLKLGWLAGSFDANNIYLIFHLGGQTNEQVDLKFPGLFDFQRVHLILSPLVYQIKFPVLENETTIYIIFRKQQQFALSCVSVNFLKGNSLEWQHGDQTKACTKSKNA